MHDNAPTHPILSNAMHTAGAGAERGVQPQARSVDRSPTTMGKHKAVSSSKSSDNPHRKASDIKHKYVRWMA